MSDKEMDRLTLRQTKVRVAWVLLKDVAVERHKWTERLQYAVQWLQDIEIEMDEHYRMKELKQ